MQNTEYEMLDQDYETLKPDGAVVVPFGDAQYVVPAADAEYETVGDAPVTDSEYETRGRALGARAPATDSEYEALGAGGRRPDNGVQLYDGRGLPGAWDESML